MNLFELLIILDLTIPSEEARRIDVDKFPHCFLYSLQKYMYVYTHIYFDCVNQEPWLDIHVYMLYHKNCFKIVRASRAIPGLSRKKLKQKDHF